MATVPQQREARAIDYPTGDGKPMAETDIHREDMTDLIETLKDFYAHKRKVYVSGNLLMCYKEDDPRKHVSPDVFVVQGVKKGRRDHYLVWREGKAPDVVFELTSKSTWREDKQTKWVIYRDILRVPEYFLFDPTRDYLKPPLQGFRLVAGDYVPIERVAGRLPSQVLSLHLERDGKELRLFDPVTGLRLQTPRERRESAERAAQAERQRAEQERRRAEQERRRAEQERQRAEAAEAAWQQSAQENERLRQELEALRRGLKSE
jgi:Uma2 family endonuclease